MVVVSLGALAALAWALRPARFDLKPAPLQPASSGCPKRAGEFLPSNYTEIPGVSLDALSARPKNRALLRLNMTPCPCGCNQSIAACCVLHPQCDSCKALAEKVLAEEQNEQPH